MQEHNTDKDECIAILHARISDIRALENSNKRLGILTDKKRIANVIGGIRRVIGYIESH